LVTTLLLLAAGCATPPPASRTSPNSEQIDLGASSIEIQFEPHLPLPRPVIVDWVRRASLATSTIFARFPVNHLVISVHFGGSDPVSDGVTHGASRIDVNLGSSAHRADLDRDWILTHEMFHLAFPTLDDRYLWMNEGLSDYLEPIARARAGQWSANEAWLEFGEGLPQGLPEPGEGGLDGSKRRERIYWGGNIYWLLADVEIRARTDNRRSLDDALRAILAAGGNGDTVWTPEKVFATAQSATGTTVLGDLYQQYGPKPGVTDLKTLWQKLGVKKRHGRVSFDDTASWAKLRAAVTAPTSPKRAALP